MSPERKFYVYAHYRVSDGRLFYIGKGSGYRSKDTWSRNPHWHKIASKHGFRDRKVIEGLPEACAYSMEKILIHLNDGLANYASGGEINSGYKWSREAREKVSLQRAGKKRSPLTEDHKAKIASAHLGRKIPREIVEKMASKKRGVKQSPERAALSRIAKIGKRQPASAVEQARLRMMQPVQCTTDGLVFPSMGHAAEHYKVSLSAVSMICSGKMPSVKGLTFRKVRA